jgi:hypothetical protein
MINLSTNAKVMVSMSNQRSTPYAPYLHNTFQVSYSPLASHSPSNPSKKTKTKQKRKEKKMTTLEGRKKNSNKQKFQKL